MLLLVRHLLLLAWHLFLVAWQKHQHDPNWAPLALADLETGAVTGRRGGHLFAARIPPIGVESPGGWEEAILVDEVRDSSLCRGLSGKTCVQLAVVAGDVLVAVTGSA